MKKLLVKIKSLHPDAIKPTYATMGAACFDLSSLFDFTIPPGAAYVLRTGLAFEIPAGHVMRIYSRSGHGFKYGVRLSNCVGVIDSDYRGEVMVRLHNEGGEHFIVNAGDRIAQAEIAEVITAVFEHHAELGETQRGTGGLGSTGA